MICSYGFFQGHLVQMAKSRPIFWLFCLNNLKTIILTPWKCFSGNIPILGWLSVIIMSRTSFRVNLQSIVCLNVKELLVRSRCYIWSLSDSNGIRTQNHLLRKRKLNHLAKLVLAKFTWPMPQILVEMELAFFFLSPDFESHCKIKCDTDEKSESKTNHNQRKNIKNLAVTSWYNFM